MAEREGEEPLEDENEGSALCVRPALDSVASSTILAEMNSWVRARVRACVRMRAHACACVRMRVHACACVCMRVHACVCVHVPGR